MPRTPAIWPADAREAARDAGAFYAEAAKFNVLPIQTLSAERFGGGIRPSLTGDCKSFTHTAGLKRWSIQ